DPADEDRREPRDGRDRTGTSHLDADAEHFGCHLLGGKLVRDGPTRLARHEAELALQLAVVDLVDDPVDLARKLGAPRRDILVEAGECLGAARVPAVAVHRKTEGLDLIEDTGERVRARETLGLAQAVGEEM